MLPSSLGQGLVFLGVPPVRRLRTDRNPHPLYPLLDPESFNESVDLRLPLDVLGRVPAEEYRGGLGTV